MLQHESEETAVPSAAQARVTPGELNAALKALEDQQNSTVAIGSVVDELRLNATPEQIWEQVQKQRTQQNAPKAAVFTPTTAPARRRLKSWREIKGWVWVLFCCCGGLGLITGGLHLANSGASTSQTIMISSDATTETIPVQGKDIVITGDGDKITLQGQARSVMVSGDNVRLRGDAPKAFDVTGDGGDVQWTEEPHPVAPRPPSP